MIRRHGGGGVDENCGSYPVIDNNAII
jgi:hypothetical protein